MIITEGFATALTVSLLTEGWIVAAVAATNLLKVTEQIRKRWPETRIILAGDNDLADGKENTGRIQAEKAAKAVDGWVTLLRYAIRLTGMIIGRKWGKNGREMPFAKK